MGRFQRNLCKQRRLWQVFTLAQSCLSLSYSTWTKSHVLAQIAILAHLCKQGRLWQVFTLAQSCLSLSHSTCTKSHVLAQIAILAHLCKQGRLWQVFTLAQSCLSLSHSTCTKSHVLAQRGSWHISVSSDGSDKSSHLHSLAWALYQVSCSCSNCDLGAFR